MKKRLQAILLALLMVAGTAVYAPPAHAAGTVTVSAVAAAAGELADVTVSLAGEDVLAGTIDVVYDSAALQLESTAATDEFHCFATPQETGRVRVAFMRTAGTADVQLATLTFRVTAETGVEGTPVILQQVSLFDGNGDPLPAQGVHGAVARKAARLSMKESDTAEYQAVRAVVELGGTLSPAGGNFSIAYDPACFQVKSVLALEVLNGKSWQYNIIEPGLVRIAFMGAGPFPAGELCAVIFETVGSAGESSTLTVTDATVFDVNSEPMDLSVENGSLNIVVPSDEDPKLWVVGGALESDGTARAAVVLQGRGYACGGNFQLSYDSSMQAVVTGSADCQMINHDPETGTIRVSWASATPYSGEEELLTVAFTGAVESDLTISGATVYFAESVPIPVVDIRPGQITTQRSVVAVVDEATVETGGTENVVSVAVDVADVKYFSDDAVETVTSVLALYDEGRLVGMQMQEASAFSGGTNELLLTAGSSKDISDVTVFLLDGSGSMLPLTDSLPVETTPAS